MNDTQILRSLMESIQKTSQPKTQPYDTTAEVRRIEDGVAWVHIAGGVDETPVRLTINAKEGDNVQVRVSGGTAFLVGNGTAPPTDDTRANIAQDTATNAQIAADTAIADAERAKEAADSAQASADSAAASAASAQVSANNANEYASRALGGLSTVQSVTETLNWITQHGTMTLTTDTALDPTHVYFVQDAQGDYVVGNVHYSIVTEPSADDLSTYYVLSIDESLQNYVGTHLAVTGEGLWVLPAATGYKVLIATGQGTQYTTAGTYIIDASGNTVARFGETAQIGNPNDANLSMSMADLTLADRSGVHLFRVHSLNTQDNGMALVKITYESPVTGQTIFTTEINVVSVYSAGYVSGEALEPPTISDGNLVFATAPNAPFWVRCYSDETLFWHSIGTYTTYQGNEDHGVNSVTIGKANYAKYDDDICIGRRLVAVRKNQFVAGRYNEADSDGIYAFIFGNGTASARKNIFCMTNDGDPHVALDTAATTSSLDGQLYAAITALGWASDVIV